MEYGIRDAIVDPESDGASVMHEEVRSGSLSMGRLRLAPRITDYCYITTRTYLAPVKEILSREPGTVLDLGCGEAPFRKLVGDQTRYIGIGLGRDRGADVVADLDTSIPIRPGTVDVVLLSEVLEHVPRPDFVLACIGDLLRPGGCAFVSTPFANMIHAHPGDYLRFTEFYFMDRARRLGFEVEAIFRSNSVLTTPFLLVPQILEPLPYVPRVAKKLTFFALNALSRLGDRFAEKLAHWSGSQRLRNFLDANPVGIAVVLRKGD